MEILNILNIPLSDTSQNKKLCKNKFTDEFCTAMGIYNLRYVDKRIAKRKTVVERYCEHLSGTDGIQLNYVQDDVKSNYTYFPVVFEEKLFGASRAEVFDKLVKKQNQCKKVLLPVDEYIQVFSWKI